MFFIDGRDQVCFDTSERIFVFALRWKDPKADPEMIKIREYKKK